MSVEAARGCGSGPGSTRTTSCPRFFNSIAAVTPLIPAPTTIAVAIALEANERSQACSNIRECVLSLRVKYPLSPFAWRVGHKNARLFVCHRSAPLRAPRHTTLGIDEDKFSAQLEILAQLLSRASAPTADCPTVLESGRVPPAKPDVY